MILCCHASAVVVVPIRTYPAFTSAVLSVAERTSPPLATPACPLVARFAATAPLAMFDACTAFAASAVLVTAPLASIAEVIAPLDTPLAIIA